MHDRTRRAVARPTGYGSRGDRVIPGRHCRPRPIELVEDVVRPGFESAEGGASAGEELLVAMT
jgi:hypothetical protein